MTDNRSGADRLDDRIDDWSDRQAGNLADHPGRTLGKWLAIIVAVVVVLSIIGGVLHFVGAWGNTAKQVISPANVTDQYQAIIGDWQSAQAEADNACSAQTAAKQGGDPVLVEDPAQAYAALFRSTVVDYNQRYLNIFKAKLVGPGGYPQPFPQELQPVGPQADWCTVSTKMRAYHS